MSFMMLFCLYVLSVTHASLLAEHTDAVGALGFVCLHTAHIMHKIPMLFCHLHAGVYGHYA